MNGGVPIDYDASLCTDNDSDNNEENEFKQLLFNTLGTNNINDENENIELNFEVPYDLHHYKDQQQLELKESELLNQESKKPTHVSTNSQFMSSINNNMLNNINDMNNNKKQKHSRKHSGGVIAPSPLKHIRAQSIIESSFTPATPMVFHPSITLSSFTMKNMPNNIDLPIINDG